MTTAAGLWVVSALLGLSSAVGVSASGPGPGPATTTTTTTLRVVSDNNYPPYVFLGADGRPRGYVVDEWKLFEKKTGVHVDFVATDWDDAQRRLLTGRADVIEMIFETPKREPLYDFTEPYATVHV